jgi:predicted ATP-grasp superfamily ATP-dependent carboligase
VRWLRLADDLPDGIAEIAHRQLGLRAYLRSLRERDSESVLSRDDPLPGLVDLALIPYRASALLTGLATGPA